MGASPNIANARARNDTEIAPGRRKQLESANSGGGADGFPLTANPMLRMFCHFSIL
jgi:hypothetical protein